MFNYSSGGGSGSGSLGQKVMMPAGNRNRLNTTTTTSANAGFTTGVTYWSPKSNGYTDIEVEWGNYLFQANGAPLTGGLAAIQMVKVAIEYPIGGTITPMYLSNYNGAAQPLTARDAMLAAGEYGKWKATVNIPRNSRYRIRYYAVTQGAATYTIINGHLTQSGKFDASAAGDAVDSGALTLYAVATQLRWTPTCVMGTSDTADVPRIAFIGDSRMAGSGGSSEPWGGITVQGDWISNGFLNNSTYTNRSDIAWAELALAGELPYLNMGIASATSVSWTAANRAAELRMLQSANITDIILDLCINDLLTGSTGDSCIARISANITLLRATLPNVRIWLCTPLPVTSSTDSYATLANQALSGVPSGGTPTNWALFTNNTGASGRSQVLLAIRNNIFGADGYIDVSAWLSDPTDERYWGSQYGIQTGDGVHQNHIGHMIAQQAVNLGKLFGIFKDTINTRKAVLTGSVYLGNLDQVVPVSTASAIATIYLPRTPLLGQSHVISDVGSNAAVNNINIYDADSNLVATINTNSASKTFVYEAGSTAHKWMIY